MNNKLKFLSIVLLIYVIPMSGCLFALEGDMDSVVRYRKRDRTAQEVSLIEIKLTQDTEASFSVLATQNSDVGNFRGEELKPEARKRFDDHLLKGLLNPEDMLLLEGSLDSKLTEAAKSHVQVQEYLARRYLGICEKLIDNTQNSLNPNHPNYQNNLRNFPILRENSIPTAKHKALEWVRKAYEQGSADAKKRLGYMLYRGFIRHTNIQLESSSVQQAIALWRLSAEQGDGESQFLTGLVFEHGFENVSQNLSEAIVWYDKAARNGDQKAKTRLTQLLPAPSYLMVR